MPVPPDQEPQRRLPQLSDTAFRSRPPSVAALVDRPAFDDPRLLIEENQDATDDHQALNRVAPSKLLGANCVSCGVTAEGMGHRFPLVGEELLPGLPDGSEGDVLVCAELVIGCVCPPAT